MGQNTRSTSKRFLQLSELMILLVGLLSVCSPGHLKHAQILQHRSPASSPRPHSRSSRTGSSRTSADAQVEPEISGASGVLRNGTVPQQTVVSQQTSNQSDAAIALVGYTVLHELTVCGQYGARDEASLILADHPLPRLGRAPPTA
jgi:hypothetical protein